MALPPLPMASGMIAAPSPPLQRSPPARMLPPVFDCRAVRDNAFSLEQSSESECPRARRIAALSLARAVVLCKSGGYLSSSFN